MAEKKWKPVPKNERVWEGVPTKEKESGFEDFGEGVMTSLMKTAYGLKDLLAPEKGKSFARPGYGSGKYRAPQRKVKTTEQDRAQIKDWSDDAGESGYGTAGEITGDIAQFLVPGTAAYKAAKAAQMGAKGLMGAEAVAGGLLGGTRLPDEGDTRLGNAAMEGSMALGGSALGHLLGPVVTGAKKTEIGKWLHEKTGKALSPEQMSDSSWLRFLDKGSNAAEIGQHAWTLQAIKESALDPDGITKIGTDGYKQIKKQFTDKYDEAWNSVGDIDLGLSKELLHLLKVNKPFVGPEGKATLNKLSSEVGRLTKHPTNTGLKDLDEIIRDLMGNSDSTGLSDALWDAKNVMRDALPEHSQDLIRQADAKYPEFLTIQRATNTARNRGHVFSPNDLMNESAFVSRLKEGTAGGKGPLQNIAKIGQNTVQKKTKDGSIEFLRKYSIANQLTPESGSFRKLAAGDSMLQKPFQAIGNLTGLKRDNPFAPAAGTALAKYLDRD